MRLLAPIVVAYIDMPVSSCSVERSFAMYRKILSDERHQLSEQSLADLLYVYVNRSVVDGIDESNPFDPNRY